MNTHSRWVPSRMPLTVCKSGAVVLNGVCTKIDFPGGTSTYANGNNGRGDIVGRYTGSDGVVHAFLLKR